MSIVQMRGGGGSRHPQVQRQGRVYAIAYDLNNELAEQHDAWRKIARVLGRHGFQRQQGSVFYGTEKTTAMTCAKAVLEMYDEFPWFWQVVRDMRMLRIDEQDDLLAIVPNRLRLGQVDAA